jgi:hypothetical protein
MANLVEAKAVLQTIAISAVANLLVDAWSRWFDSAAARRLEERSGLWAGLASVCRGGGIDVVKIIRGVSKILTSIATRPKH